MQTDDDITSSKQGGALRRVGILMAVASVVAILALMHHPVGHGGDARAVLASMRTQAGVDQLVHGTLAAVFQLLAVGMFLFAMRLDLRRPVVMIGVVAYAAALTPLVLATLIDGFVAPAIAARCVGAIDQPCTGEALAMLHFGGLLIEFLTRFTFAVLTVAVLAWSVALLRTRSAPKWAGWLGLASGAIQLLALVTTTSRLNPRNLLVMLVAHVAWCLVVATLLILRPGPFADDRPETGYPRFSTGT